MKVSAKIIVLSSLFQAVLFLNACTEISKKKSVTHLKEAGDSIVAVAQGTLLKTLSHQIKENGIDNTIGYCNVKALPIMDSLSKVYMVKISRVSEKYRNEQDKPLEVDSKVLSLLASGKKDYVDKKNGIYYSSIKIGMPTCLKCHGGKEDITPLTAQKISALYPNDKAVGYQIGDFRGAWKIQFLNNK